MSDKEYVRLEELQKVREKRQTIKQAAGNLGLSIRQTKRLSKRLREEGPKGLISKKLGRPGNHRLPAGLEDLVCGLIQDLYPDFGPTLAHEYLTEKDHVPISVSSVRGIMIKKGLWVSKAHKKKRVFQLRPRRSRQGELIQVDGSDEKWFEDRGPSCTLLNFVDDATSGIMHLRLVKSENVLDYFDATRQYIEKHGRPEAFYPDKHGVFRVNREGALSGTGLTQFGRAMEELDIRLICANTPQAKGRVERRHKDLQDRLIKAMRLQKISTIEEANAFLPSFIEDFNRRFAKAPQDPTNAHRPLLASHSLDRVFSLKETRQLSKNLTLQYKNITYQIITERASYAMRKAVVTVLESRDGTVRIEYKGKSLTAVPYHQVQARTEVISAKEIDAALAQEKKKYRPGPRHPWKSARRGFSTRKVPAYSS